MLKEPPPVPYRLLACKLIVKLPSSRGVPETTPLARSNAKPAGKPDAASHTGSLTGSTRELNSLPSTAGTLSDATPGSGKLTTSVTVHWPTPRVLVANSTTEYVPAWMGCPVIKPVAVSTANPGGRPLAPYEVAPFLAIILYWKGRSTVLIRKRRPTSSGVATPPGSPVNARS